MKPVPVNEKTQVRSTYRHGDLRRALLEAGIELARANGPDAVVLREATRRAGVAPNAAYRHFESRQALLQAVRAADWPARWRVRPPSPP
ncbi:MAG: TetR/AcrR family transcriptional regulator, partial [Haliea sp.]